MSITKEITSYANIYLIGIGGIGMSAIARYFNQQNYTVAGYDKTQTKLTKKLIDEGINIHFSDDTTLIPADFINAENTLIIYTPAIPNGMKELKFFQTNNFEVIKRSEALGKITRNSKALGVAGTHGKTTTSCMLAYILDQTEIKCNAFLGGISSNFNSNFISSKTSDFTVIEADEFDRSFLKLSPFASIITSTDADHLDIYNSEDEFLEGFKAYSKLVNENGVLILNEKINLEHPNLIKYGFNESADYQGYNLKVDDGAFLFDLKTPTSVWENIELGIPGIHNIENAISCIAMAEFLGLNQPEIRAALKSFKGVKRRFEYHVKQKEIVYIDDYAHHPTEIKALIDSVQFAYPGKKITGIFQPHLFSRTKDFWGEFSTQLSRIDSLYLLPIYPARELPIDGINSDQLIKNIKSPSKQLVTKETLLETVMANHTEIVLTIGAGDIDTFVEPIKTSLSNEKVD